MGINMDITYYRIINYILEVRREKGGGIPLFLGFEIEKPDTGSDILIELWEREKNILPWYGIEYYHSSNEYPHIFFGHGEPKVRMVADQEYNHFIIEGVEHSLSGAMELLLAGFYSWLSKRNCMLAHASLIEYQGGAIMFSGASGAGKTTQAELWRDYKKANILNGDKVILEMKNKVMAWGSPWRGSSPYALNQSASLKGIVLLEQGKENKIRQLNKEEIMLEFLPHVFYPFWDKDCVNRMMEVLESVLEQVPIYHLLCKADEEAVEITYKAVWKCEK